MSKKLHQLISNKKWDEAHKLIANGRPDFTVFNGEYETPLQAAIDKKAPISLIQAMLEAGADVDYADKDNMLSFHPLELAAYDNNVELARLLLDHGAKTDFEHEYDGSHVAFCACNFKSFDVIDLLIKYGFDVNHQDEDGNALLHFAAWQDAKDDDDKCDRIDYALGLNGIMPLSNSEGHNALYVYMSAREFRAGDDQISKKHSVEPYPPLVEFFKQELDRKNVLPMTEDTINRLSSQILDAEKQFLNCIEELRLYDGMDMRWVSESRTDVQKGRMCAIRAISEGDPNSREFQEYKDE